jgi:isoleucyl-tRNA synthetase
MNGTPPYKGVLTHGFVVDEDGRKMSKSIGNVVGPQEIINNSGADTLRFWIAATDFRGEMAFSKDIFNRSVDGFRRIRNTMRFMISNLYDYDQNDQVTKVLFLDKAIISKTAKLQNEIRELYKEFNFHQVVSKIVNFCVNDLGSLYLDVIKDRLYTMQPESEGRRSAQYALAIVLDFLNKAISPILPFTAYEFSENLSNGNGDKIFYSEWEEYENRLNKVEEEEFELLVQLRQRAYQEIEEERKKKDIKNALDCDLEITLEKELFDKISKYSDEMNKILICSSCSIFLGKSEQILVKKSVNEKCTRCWHKVEELENGICKRCINNMSGEGEVRRFF